jgi:hypothetical protein
MIVLLRYLGREWFHSDLRDQRYDEQEREGYKHEPQNPDNSKECLHTFTIRRFWACCGKIGTLFPHSVNGAGLRQQPKAHA